MTTTSRDLRRTLAGLDPEERERVLRDELLRRHPRPSAPTTRCAVMVTIVRGEPAPAIPDAVRARMAVKLITHHNGRGPLRPLHVVELPRFEVGRGDVGVDDV